MNNPDQLRTMSFCSIDQLQGRCTVPPEERPDETSLEVWYRSLYKQPFEDFSVFDLARACRQQVHVEFVVPYCLHVLQQDPIAGDMYDGELAVSLKEVPRQYWREHPGERAKFLSVVGAVRAAVNADPESDLEADGALKSDWAVVEERAHNLEQEFPLG